MMKKYIILTAAIFLTVATSLYSQNITRSINQITSADLESYVSFLASPLLMGRENGEEGLDIAANYIASQAKLNGLNPANTGSYFQPYQIIKRTIDTSKTIARIVTGGNDTVKMKEPLLQLVPTGPSDFVVEGDVVFAGYGIKSEKYKYNDFENIDTDGKILLVMTRAPSTEDGKKFLFDDVEWSSFISMQFKLSALLFTRARAILMVMDPKSGFSSFEEQFPGYADELESIKSLKGENKRSFEISGMPKIIFIRRSFADELLKGSGHSLEELQLNIDGTLTPHSFAIPHKHLIINEVSIDEEITLYNVAGYMEGRDPELKNEVVVFSAHYDHIGSTEKVVYTGADDDASGCASLLSIAKAFKSLKKKPLRSVLFLWVSGEEIGLFGSKSYIDNPLFPIEKTVADLNMDMIGRVKGVADSTAEYPMTGPESVFVITDNQSKELRSIADDIDRKSSLDFDYSLSGKDHPLQLFARSDHYNFVKKDIPVLFFSTGLHADYHTPRDVVGKIDFKKMELVTRTMYRIGFTIADRKTRITVDNPFSSW